MQRDITKSFSKSLIETNSVDLLIENSEVGLDHIFDNDLIEEIPIIKNLVGIYKFGVSIKERFTVKKILKFLSQTADIPIEDKEDFLDKLARDEEYCDDVFEKLLVILDKLDDLEKSKIIGNLFKAAIKGQISLDTFFRLSSAIEKLFIDDIKALCLCNRRGLTESDFRKYGGLFHKEDTRKNLSSVGLMKEEIEEDRRYQRYNRGEKTQYKFKYSISSLGDQLIDFAGL